MLRNSLAVAALGLLVAVPMLADSAWSTWLGSQVTPIKEKDLLEWKKRWPQRKVVESDSLRGFVATKFGYTDSTGSIPEKVSLSLLSSCNDTSSSVPLHYYLYHIVGIEGDKDESIWMYITDADDNYVAENCIGILQTSCSSTVVRGCIAQEDGSLEVHQLEHHFNCDTDEFINTEITDHYILRLRDNGSFAIEIQESK